METYIITLHIKCHLVLGIMLLNLGEMDNNLFKLDKDQENLSVISGTIGIKVVPNST